MATPARGLPLWRGRNTPHGKFWMGKSLSAGTGTQERRAGSFVGFMSPSRYAASGASKQSQRAQVVARLLEAAAAEREPRVAPQRDDPIDARCPAAPEECPV